MSADLQAWLEGFLADHQGVAGTVHVRPGAGDLELAAAHNIPPQVQEIVRHIPRGKGMAGLAWERDEAVSTCNIKDDRSGQVRPGAKAVNAGAGVALPVHDASGGVRAVVGIAYRDEKELTASELAELSAAAATLPEGR
jgi:L-methionine (R)-S-oxide reductase